MQMKRVFDIGVAGVGLILLAPLFLLLALLIKIDSPGPVFFRQERIGRGLRPFFIYKFRTMVADAPRRGGPITVGADPRITRVGRILRATKLDELPQLLNVLKGEMSLVGPRPEVRRYVELFRQDYEEILSVRPGITDLASLRYRYEAELLAAATDPEEEYVSRVLPEKIRLAKEYTRRSSLLFDVTLIWKTLVRLFHRRPRL
jgi:lipopolysaccharide/colanic/teichoic acid biosynthesis glycosyltransferase